MFTIRRVASTLIALGLALAAAVVNPLPASAALPTCTTWRVHNEGNVPATGSGSVDCLMSQGAMSEGVRFLQYSLIYCYGANIASDGEFGPRTKAALRSAQQQAGAAQDGRYGPETRRKMLHRGTAPIFGCVHVS
jgi:peptidoglycan hydrolase-like protein with peptidoglycan-binding domain